MKPVYSFIFGVFFYALALIAWLKTGSDIQIGSFVVCANIWIAASLITAREAK